MTSVAALAGLEDIIGRARVAARIEALLPIGVRHRQLPVRTLLLGMALALADHRPAHLTRVHAALTSLPAGDQVRLGVIAGSKNGPHLLTYRQTERTFGLAVRALDKDTPDGAPSPLLTRICDDLLEASIPDAHKNTEYRPLDNCLSVGWDQFGRIGPVTPDAAEYEISGMRVISHWFDYRKRNPSGRRGASDLDAENLRRWTNRMTEELRDLVAVIEGCVSLEQRQADVLDRIVRGPILSTAELTEAEVVPPPDALRRLMVPDDDLTLF